MTEVEALDAIPIGGEVCLEYFPDAHRFYHKTGRRPRIEFRAPKKILLKASFQATDATIATLPTFRRIVIERQLRGVVQRPPPELKILPEIYDRAIEMMYEKSNYKWIRIE